MEWNGNEKNRKKTENLSNTNDLRYKHESKVSSTIMYKSYHFDKWQFKLNNNGWNKLSNSLSTNGVFFSTTFLCTLFKKNAVLCLFLKNVLPSKRVVCFILNNLHFPMVKGIAFYALYKSRVLIIPCKADDFCLFIGLPDEI